MRLILIGCIVAFAIGSVGSWLAPQILFGAMQQFGISAAQAGTLTLIEGVMSGLLSMALGALPPPIRYRYLAIGGVVLFVVANGATQWLAGFNALLFMRFAAGVADAILVFVAVSLVAMRSANPDKSYAVLNIAANIFGAIVLMLLPVLSPSRQGLLYLPFVAVVGLLLLPALLSIPGDIKPSKVEARHSGATAPTTSRLATTLFVILFLLMVPLCFQSILIFAYSPGIGTRMGLSEAAINTTLGGATLASIIGPFAAVAANRLGRARSLLALTVIQLAFNIGMTHATSHAFFSAAVFIDVIAAYFFIPLLLAWAAELDHTGRHSSIMMGGIIVVTSVAPAAGGLFINRFGLDALQPLVIASGAGFVVLMLMLCVPLLSYKRAQQAQLLAS